MLQLIMDTRDLVGDPRFPWCSVLAAPLADYLQVSMMIDTGRMALMAFVIASVVRPPR